MSTPRAIRAARRSQMLPPEPPEDDPQVDDIEPDFVTDSDFPDTEPESDDESTS